MKFTEALNNTTSNISYTENGMQGYKTTNSPYLDFLYKISSLRQDDDSALQKDCNSFIELVFSSKEQKYLLKFILHIRDPRNGLGERRTGRELLSQLFTNFDFENKDEVFEWVLNHLYEYSRWDDLICLMQGLYLTTCGLFSKDNTPYSQSIINRLKSILESDLKLVDKNTPITLLAKWMPSINTSSYTTRSLAQFFVMKFGWSKKQYRQTLSKLRKYLKVTERQMSLNEWEEIDYEKVPSLANLRYKDAFLKHNNERRTEYLKALSKGEAKINSSVNFPYDIVHSYTKYDWIWANLSVKNYDKTLEQLWKNLNQIDGLKDTLVVRDDSGSMTSKVGRTSITALEVATALGIYCAEHCSEEYKDKIISFSRTPKYLDFNSDIYPTLHDKLEFLYEYSEVANTNIRKVFQLILKTAIENKLKQEDLPKQILIISDMEFDQGASYSGNPIEESQVEYEKYGYKVPKLVFWNVCSRTNTIPVKENELGVYLLSGFSPNVLSMLSTGKLNPLEALFEELDKKYKEVLEIK